MKPYKFSPFIVEMMAVLMIVPASFLAAQSAITRVPEKPKVLQSTGPRRSNGAVDLQTKPGPRFDVRRVEEQRKILQHLQEERIREKGIQTARKQTELIRKTPVTAKTRIAKKARILGRVTRFNEAPPSMRSSVLPRLASLSNSNLLVNGKTQDTVFIGEPLILTFAFAPNALSATLKITADANGNGLADSSDLVLEQILLLDNDDNDGNSSLGTYRLELDRSDLIAAFACPLIFEVNDYATSSSATAVVRQRPMESLVVGTLTPPFPGILVYIDSPTFCAAVTDSAGQFSFYVDRDLSSTVTLFGPFDYTGVSNGYVPPVSQKTSVLSDTTQISIAYSKATSFVEGYLRDQTGTGVAGAIMHAYGSDFGELAHTNSEGYYKIGVSPGNWSLYLEQLPTPEFLGLYPIYQSLVVPVNGTVRRDLRVLKSNGTISGKVTLSDQGLGGVPMNADCDSLENEVLTKLDGTYSIPVFTFSTVSVKYIVYPYLNEGGYYLPVETRSSISPGAVGVDFTVSKVTGGIKGRITDQLTGLPVANAEISVSGPSYRYTSSDDSGYYRLSLRDGDYSLSVYADRYYTYSDPNLSIYGVMLTRNISLRKPGSISGKVLNVEGVAVRGAFVTAIDTAGYYYYASGTSDTAGNYVVSGLSTSRYKVQCSANGYITEWYDNAADFGRAATVQVTEGYETPGIDFTLSQGGSISGRVANNTGNPVDPVEIEVVDSVYSIRSYTFTNDSGYYKATGLLSGNYFVVTYSDQYIDEWYDGASSFSSAKRVPVIIGRETPNINFVLASGGTIAGKVLTREGVAITFASLTVMDSTFSSIAYGYTDYYGAYSIKKLEAGIKLYVYASAYGYGGRWFDSATTPASAKAIVLQPEETRTGVDFVLPMAGSLSGRIADAAGNALAYANVYAEDKMGNILATGYCDYQGVYTISYLSPGEYVAEANSYGYDPQWYDHKDFASEADRISVAEGQTTSNINFDLRMQGMARTPKFIAFIDRVEHAPIQNRSAIVDSFVAAIPSVPFIEQDTVVYFLYRGSAASVTVPGDANEWNINSFTMTRLSSTDLWYYCAVLPSDARLEYKFYVDGAWRLDLLNSSMWNGPGGSNSELRMPKYVPPIEVAYDPSIAHGSTAVTSFHSTILNNTRIIRWYTPPGYSSAMSDSFPVIVFHDGQDYVTGGSAANTLDYLIANKLIRPTIGIFVTPIMRDSEYVGSQQDRYAALIANELMPWAESQYRILKNPLDRSTVGVSNGGNIALWISYKYPGSFGNAGSFSGAILPTTTSAFQNTPQMQTRLYVDAGTYESYIRGVSNDFVDVAASKGYAIRHSEWHEGHTWGNWRAHLDNALRFFNDPNVDVEHTKEPLPVSYQLMQNYPNPFNPGTTISFDVPTASLVTLKVFNLLGQEITTLVSKELRAGSYRFRFDAGRLASGVYIYQLRAGSYVQSRKMILMK